MQPYLVQKKNTAASADKIAYGMIRNLNDEAVEALTKYTNIGLQQLFHDNGNMRLWSWGPNQEKN